MTRWKTWAALTAACLAAIMATEARATTITATFKNFNNSTGVSNARTFDYNWNSSNGSAYSGMFQWVSTTPNDLLGAIPVGGSTNVNGVSASNSPTSYSKEFVTFCIQLVQHVNFGQQVVFDVDDPSNAPKPVNLAPGAMGTTKAGLVGILWHEYMDAGEFLNGTDDGYDRAAGFQIAIWEIVNEGLSNGLNLTTGAFKTRNGSNSSFTKVTTAGTAEYYAQQYLAFVQENRNNPNARRASLVALTSDLYQDQLAEVPEPATLGLAVFGVATALFGGWRRRRLGNSPYGL